MRFVLYNIRYGTGSGPGFHWPVPFSGYFRRTRKNLASITSFLKAKEPDLVGLIEVDNGSYRSKKSCQAALIAKELGFDHVYRSKYPRSSFAQNVPVLRDQGNAFLTNLHIEDHGFHLFRNGIKRMVLELEFQAFTVFLVHLSLKYRHRQYQLRELYTLFAEVKGPVIVAGDFNAFWGNKELDLFLAATGLLNANRDGDATFPSDNPRRQLDFILHSPSLKVTNFQISTVQLSDHLPLVCDFEISEKA
ncbi:MAG: endonuclease/exonuclease/phosphatase family protein [Candidatus Hydrogenedentes bacterium]|jgi:endonuclease/exonuclease/phosphatase family metal-dependent hydrolase|nr:endonuclease/exonuclease/phosphatase family protein [Candidatus Hydrogenedentota bacterium]